MKRIYTLVVLLGLVIGAVTGCSDSGGGGSTPSTNAAPAAPSTNATK